jgi:hypothetical protein
MTGDWQARLRADPTAWLLEKNNPSVRRLALMTLAGKTLDDPEVRLAAAEVMHTGAVPRILRAMNPEGFWEAPDAFYTAKYRGSVWQLIILAELGADGEDQRVRRACEFLLAVSQDPESGGFAMHRSTRTGGGRHSEVIPCLTGNMVYSLIRLGLLQDPRVRRGIDYITRTQRFDDCDGPAPTGWPYDRFEICWGRHSCHMGAVKALKALEAIPAGERSTQVARTLEQGAEYLLRHRVHKRSHDPKRVSKPGWLRFGFPLMYQTDVLEILLILTRLGYRDERMQEAMDAVLAAQNERGRWKLANTFNGRFQVDIEKKGEPSKWITLRALEAIKSFYGPAP